MKHYKSGEFCQFLECQAPRTNVKPPTETQRPLIENFLATVLVSSIPRKIVWVRTPDTFVPPHISNRIQTKIAVVSGFVDIGFHMRLCFSFSRVGIIFAIFFGFACL